MHLSLSEAEPRHKKACQDRYKRLPYFNVIAMKWFLVNRPHAELVGKLFQTEEVFVPESVGDFFNCEYFCKIWVDTSES